MTDLFDLGSSAFWRVNPRDSDPQETREWLDAFDALVEAVGRARDPVGRLIQIKRRIRLSP